MLAQKQTPSPCCESSVHSQHGDICVMPDFTGCMCLQVVLTDIDECMEDLQENVDLQKHHSAGKCTAQFTRLDDQLTATSDPAGAACCDSAQQPQLEACRPCLPDGTMSDMAKRDKAAADTLEAAAKQVQLSAIAASSGRRQSDSIALKPGTDGSALDPLRNPPAAGNAPEATGRQVKQTTRLACAELDWENHAQLAALGTFDVVLVADVVSFFHAWIPSTY